MVPGNAGRDIYPAPKLAREEGAERLPGRTYAVVIGIDEHADERLRLECAVNDAESVARAIRDAQPREVFSLDLLISPPQDEDATVPNRLKILETVAAVARSAQAGDTVFIYFAGHGIMVGEHPCLVPADARYSGENLDQLIAPVLPVADLLKLFAASPCKNRVLVLDCCQTRTEEQMNSLVSANSSVGRSVGWQTGRAVTEQLVESFYRLAWGWSILLSCGPDPGVCVLVLRVLFAAS